MPIQTRTIVSVSDDAYDPTGQGNSTVTNVSTTSTTTTETKDKLTIN